MLAWLDMNEKYPRNIPAEWLECAAAEMAMEAEHCTATVPEFPYARKISAHDVVALLLLV